MGEASAGGTPTCCRWKGSVLLQLSAAALRKDESVKPEQNESHSRQCLRMWSQALTNGFDL